MDARSQQEPAELVVEPGPSAVCDLLLLDAKSSASQREIPLAFCRVLHMVGWLFPAQGF